MEEKKINVKKVNLITIGVVILVFGIIIYLYYLSNMPESSIKSIDGVKNVTTIYSNTNKKAPKHSNVEYEIITWMNPDISNFYLDNAFISSNEMFMEYMSEGVILPYNIYEKFDDKFFESKNLAITIYYEGATNHDYSINSVIKENEKGIINISDNYSFFGAIASNQVFNFIILDKEIEEVEFNIYEKNTKVFCNSDYIMLLRICMIFIEIILLVNIYYIKIK